jgi:SAM-dependent methyltransferase
MVTKSTERNYKTVNRQGWTRLARQGIDSSMPIKAEDLPSATEWIDPSGWINWQEVKSVLCLACGGGQQAPLFASLGCKVVSADLCPEQLERDRQAARALGLNLVCVEADMLDLSSLYGRDFDLVYQAISACYVPDVRRLYVEVSRVLKPSGFYRVEHWSPINMQLADEPWTGRGYELVRPCISGQVNEWQGGDVDSGAPECWHYMHTMGDLIGGLCDAGFHILRYVERASEDESATPGSEAHLAAYVRPYLTIYSQRFL